MGTTRVRTAASHKKDDADYQQKICEYKYVYVSYKINILYNCDQNWVCENFKPFHFVCNVSILYAY